MKCFLWILSSEAEYNERRINALKLYIKQFPETTSGWTRLAYFNIALEYYKIKDFAEAVKQEEKLFGTQLSAAK